VSCWRHCSLLHYFFAVRDDDDDDGGGGGGDRWQVLVAVLGVGLPVGALAAVVIILVVTRRRYHRPMSAHGGESTSGIATLSDAECDVMNNRRPTSPSPVKTKCRCDYAASKSTKDMISDDLTHSTSGNHIELPPGRCAKVSNEERQRSTRRPDSGSRGSYRHHFSLPYDGQYIFNVSVTMHPQRQEKLKSTINFQRHVLPWSFTLLLAVPNATFSNH